MSIFSLAGDAARILANIGALGQHVGTAAAAGGDAFNPKRGEYLASLGTSAGADFAGAVLNTQRALQNVQIMMVKANPKLVQSSFNMSLRWGPSIILTTLTVVEGLELFAGFGPPAEGDKLKDGSQQFTTLCGQLKSALPDARWQGSAAQAYTDQTTGLQNIAQTLAELDNRLAALVKDQADWVTHMRLGFGILKDLLIAAYLIEMALGIMPAPTGPTLATIFASLVCVGGIAVAMGFLTTLGICSVVNAVKVDALTTQYTEKAAAAVQKGTQLTQTGAAEAAKSTVSGLEDTSASMLRMSAIADVSTSAGVASSGDERPALSARTGAGETPGDGSPEIPPIAETPDKTTPSTPSFTVPTLAQLTALSGQATKLSEALSPHTNLVDQMMGQIQQLAQRAQQRQGALAPTEQAAPEEAALAGASAVRATLAGDVEGAEAAVGTQTVERAPIEVAAVDPEGAREPSPAERVL
jgi:uncharacterized protein YukE